MHHKIAILDFGSQYTQLIARKVRELNVYCEVFPYSKFPQDDNNIRGVILSGSPFSVRQKDAPIPDLSEIRGKIPLLGICYGAQYLAHASGGIVSPAEHREYGRAGLRIVQSNDILLRGVQDGSQVWMSHADTIIELPKGFHITASTENIKVGAYRIEGEPTFGLQFHPEVYHTEEGQTILKNFLTEVCKIEPDWTSESFIESTVAELKSILQDDKVVLGLSGGVDSTVAGVLLDKAIGKQLSCIFIDNGLLRKNEFEHVLHQYKDLGLNVIGVDAKADFYAVLKRVEEPEKKRKAIGNMFIEIFDREAAKIKEVKWLAQGTIYPDVIESVSVNGPSVTIKSHHNVGGLPAYMKLKITEPLRMLFKDEVRRVGKALDIPQEILGRHPFPGPGLGIRILGEVTPEKVGILQEADAIFISELQTDGLYEKVWQAAAILLPVKSVGVMGDERTYENTLVLRAVNSTDGMTADWSHLPHSFLAKVSNKIINQVPGINRVVYDISSKPPATIEWE
jgi:GMP synthase (glutamine-hydrolysing)